MIKMCMTSGVMVTMKLRKINWIRAKNMKRRYTVNKMCECKGFTSPVSRKGMFKFYDLLIKFCWEIKDSYGQ